MTRTQVAIVGAGPSGLLLSQLLHNDGIETIVLERQSREHVAARIRAGVLEQGTVELLLKAGVGQRMLTDRLVHEGFALGFADRSVRVDLRALTGAAVSIYGQTELTRDLIDARIAAGAKLLFEATNVAIDGFARSQPDGTLHARGPTCGDCLRFHRRLRRLPRHMPQKHSLGCNADLRAGVSLWLARNTGRRAAGQP